MQNLTDRMAQTTIGNPFDQFDPAPEEANPFDAFDVPAGPAPSLNVAEKPRGLSDEIIAAATGPGIVPSPPKIPEPGIAETASRALSAFVEQTLGAGGATIQAAAEGVRENIVKPVARSGEPVALGFTDRIDQLAEIDRAVDARPNPVADYGRGIAEERRANVQELRAGIPEGSGKALLFDAASNAPQLLVPAAIGLANPAAGMAAGLSLAGVSSFGGRYDELRNQRGLSVNESLAGSGVAGAAEILTEKLPLDLIIKTGDKTGLFGAVKRVAAAAGAEGAQEGIVEAIEQAYNEGVLGDNVTLGEALEKVGYSALVGAIVGGAARGVSEVGQAALGRKPDPTNLPSLGGLSDAINRARPAPGAQPAPKSTAAAVPAAATAVARTATDPVAAAATVPPSAPPVVDEGPAPTAEPPGLQATPPTAAPADKVNPATLRDLKQQIVALTGERKAAISPAVRQTLQDQITDLQQQAAAIEFEALAQAAEQRGDASAASRYRASARAALNQDEPVGAIEAAADAPISQPEVPDGGVADRSGESGRADLERGADVSAGAGRESAGRSGADSAGAAAPVAGPAVAVEGAASESVGGLKQAVSEPAADAEPPAPGKGRKPPPSRLQAMQSERLVDERVRRDLGAMAGDAGWAGRAKPSAAAVREKIRKQVLSYLGKYGIAIEEKSDIIGERRGARTGGFAQSIFRKGGADLYDVRRQFPEFFESESGDAVDAVDPEDIRDMIRGVLFRDDRVMPKYGPLADELFDALGREQDGDSESLPAGKLIPRAPWFATVQAAAPLQKNTDGEATREAVRKALAGEPMAAAERRHVEAMLGELDRIEAEVRAAAPSLDDFDAAIAMADAAEIADQFGDEGGASAIDHALVQAASVIDEDAVERAAIQAGDDDAAFMAAIKEIINAKSEGAREDRDAGGVGEEVQDVDGREAGRSEGGKPEAGRVEEGLKPADGIEVYPGKGLIKDKFLSRVDGETTPGGPWDTEQQARAAALAYAEQMKRAAVSAEVERQRRANLADRIRRGESVTDAALESIGLRPVGSDVKYFFPVAAELFGISSRDVRPIVRDIIKLRSSDMGTTYEYVPTREALRLVAAATRPQQGGVDLKPEDRAENFQLGEQKIDPNALDAADRPENFAMTVQSRTDEQAADEARRKAEAGQGDLLGGKAGAALEAANRPRSSGPVPKIRGGLFGNQNSRGQGQPKNPTPGVARAREELAGALGDRMVGSLEDAGLLVIEADESVLPASARGTGVRGWFNDGVIHLFPQNIERGSVVSVLLHEGTHHSAPEDAEQGVVASALGVQGAEAIRRFDRLRRRGSRRDRALAEEAMAMAIEEVRQLRAEGIDVGAERLQSEALAYLVELAAAKPAGLSAAMQKLVADLVAALKAYALRSPLALALPPTTRTRLAQDWSAADFVRAARRHLEIAAAQAESGRQSGAYSRGKKPVMEEGDKRMFRRAPGNFTEAEQRAWDAFLKPRADRKLLLANLEKHAGTPWAAQAIEGVFTRQAMLEAIAGRDPEFQSAVAQKRIDRLKAGGMAAAWDVVEIEGAFVSEAAKPVNNVSSSFINCNPSTDCAKYCYATGGNYKFAGPMVKSELVTMLVEADPVRSARRVAQEYKATFEFANNKALRLFDKGDGTEAWLPFIEALNREGVRTQIFSKNPDFLRQVSDFNVRMLSVDDSNIGMADENPDLKTAFVYSDRKQLPDLVRLVERDQVAVILPVKLGQKILGDDMVAEIRDKVRKAKPLLCPIDAGIKKLGSNSDPKGWNCTKCDKGGGVGCFHGSVTSTVMSSLEVTPARGDTAALILKRAEALENEIARILEGGGNALAGDGGVGAGSLLRVLQQARQFAVDVANEGRAAVPAARDGGAGAQGRGAEARVREGAGRDRSGVVKLADLPKKGKFSRQRRAVAGQAELFVLRNTDPLDRARIDALLSDAEFATETQTVAVGERMIGTDRIRTPADLAKAAAYLSDYAAEHLDAYLTDRDGRVLAVVGGFKGDRAAAAVYVNTVLAETMPFGEGAKLWVAHNHPSGMPELSPADVRLMTMLGETFRGTGIDVAGIIAIGADTDGKRDWSYRGFSAGGASTPEYGTVTSVDRQVAVPTMSTILKRRGAMVGGLSSPQESKLTIPRIAGARPGVVLLNTQNAPTGFVPIPREVAGLLRGNDRGLRRLYAAATRANAGAAVIANPDGAYTLAEMQNIGAALQGADIRTLDAVVYDTGASTNAKSLAERGENLVAPSFYSRQQTRTPEFKRWFGDSKVVDANGEPLVVYHGTGKNVAEFDMSKVVRAGFGDGAHFAENPKLANLYAEQWENGNYVGRGDNVMPVYLSLQNPFLGDNYYVEMDKRGLTSHKAMRESLQADGYDGIRYLHDPKGGVAWVAFRPEQIKSAIGNSGAFNPADPRMAFSRQKPLYSALTRAVEGAKQAKAPATQWKGMLANMPGVKREEIDWSGVEQWLDQQAGPVTRDALVDYLKQNEVQVDEVMLGAGDQQNDAYEWGALNDELPLGTKYAQYQLPGGKSYRELLLTLPKNESIKTKEFAVRGAFPESFATREAAQSHVDQINAFAESDAGAPLRASLARFPLSIEEVRVNTLAAKNYISGHFDQTNVLAHVRFNERTTPRTAYRVENQRSRNAGPVVATRAEAEAMLEKYPESVRPNLKVIETEVPARTLFIEEVQSDWHQEGRKKGYATPGKLPDGWTVARYDRRVYPGGPVIGEEWIVFDKTKTQVGLGGDTRESAISNATGSMTLGVPDAPFKQSWPMLAMKRMIRYAAENGFDRIAWTTGEQQAERYDLSKKLDKVRYEDNNSGGSGRPRLDGEPASGNFYAYDRDGNLVMDRYLQDPVKELPEVIGKEIAERLLNAAPAEARQFGLGVRRRELSGIDLQVGGEGMKAFYDRELVNEVGKYVKKWGAKVERTAIDAIETPGSLFEVVLPNGKVIKTTPHKAQATATARDFDGAIVREARNLQAVHAIDVTPAMREAAMAGQPMFSRQRKPPTDGGRAGVDAGLDQDLANQPFEYTDEEWLEQYDTDYLNELIDAHNSAMEYDDRITGHQIQGARDLAADFDRADRLGVRYNKVGARKVRKVAKMEMPSAPVAPQKVPASTISPWLAMELAYQQDGVMLAEEAVRSNPGDLALRRKLKDAKARVAELERRVANPAAFSRQPRRIAIDRGGKQTPLVGDQQDRGPRRGEVIVERSPTGWRVAGKGTGVEDKDVRRALLVVQGERAAFARQQPAATQGALFGQQVGAWSTPEPTALDRVIYNFQNKMIDAKRIVDELAKAGPVADSQDTVLREELYYGRVADRTQAFAKGELRGIVEAIQREKVTIAEVDEFLVMRHVPEANRRIARINPNRPDLQDGGSGHTNAEARAYMALLPPERRAAFERIAAKVDDMIERTRDGYVAAGLETQDMVDSWRATYQHYVPLKPMPEEGVLAELGIGTGQGFDVRGPATPERIGPIAKPGNVLANLVAERERLIVRDEKNRVGKSLVALAISHPRPDFWMPVDPATSGRTPAERIRLEAALRELGLAPPDAAGVLDEPVQRYYDDATGQVKERINPALRNYDNVLAVRIDGRDVFLFLNKNSERALRLAHAMKNLDAEKLGTATKAFGFASRWFASVNTQYNPVFGIFNLLRDVQGAVLNLASTPLAGKRAKVLGEAVKIFGSMMKAGFRPDALTGPTAALYQQFAAAGGKTGYMDIFANANDRTRSLNQEVDPFAWMTDTKIGRVFTAGGKLRLPYEVAQRLLAPLFRWLSAYNDALENTTRLAAFKVALEQGLPVERAASIGKNLTTNFNRKGSKTAQAGALYAFFNAAVQGSTRIGETMFTRRDGRLRLNPTGRNIIAGGVLLGVMQQVALSLAGYNDDDPPQYVRERSLILPLPGGNYFAMPMPLGYHVLPNLGRMATEALTSDEDRGVARAIDFAMLAVEAFNPVGSGGTVLQTLLPTALDPIAQLNENVDGFGGDIAIKDMNRLDPTPGFTRAKLNASPMGEWIAVMLNGATGGNEYVPGEWSPTPDQVDHVLGTLGGGVAREGMKLAAIARSPITGEEIERSRVPLLGRLFGKVGGQDGTSRQFYAAAERVNRAAREAKGRAEDGKDIPPDMENVAGLEKLTDKVLREVGKLRKEKRRLMEAGATRAEIREIDEAMTGLMREVSEEYAAAR